jgi:hypothetical protein
MTRGEYGVLTTAIPVPVVVAKLGISLAGTLRPGIFAITDRAYHRRWMPAKWCGTDLGCIP